MNQKNKGQVHFNRLNANRNAWIPAFILFTAAVAFAEFPVVTASGDQQNPAVYGSIIVWQDNRSGNWDIYGYDLSKNEEFVICDNPADQTDPDIYEQYVVWKDTRDDAGNIYGYNLNTKSDITVTTAPAEQGNPAIHKNGATVIVVFDDLRNPPTKDIYRKNVTGGSDTAVTTATQEQSVPDIYGSYVVWQDNQNYNFDIYGRNLNSGGVFSIYTGTGMQQYPAIYENIVIWQDNSSGNWDIKGKNLSTGASLTISASTGNQTRPAICGDLVVWQDDRSGDLDIYLYRLSTQEEMPIPAASTVQEIPAVSTEAVVWRDQREGSYDVFGYQPIANAEVETAAEVTEGITSGTTIGAQGMDVTIEGYEDFRDVWYLFTPDETARYIISLCDSGFDTTLAVFDLSLHEIEFNEDYCGLQSQLILKGIAGKTYFIRIAGYDGTTGDFEMEIAKAAEGGGTLTKLPDSSYYQGAAPYAFFIYPDPTPADPDPEPEAILSGRIEFAVYDTVDFPDEFPEETVPGEGRYIYACQVFNGSEDFLGFPQESLELFLMQAPTPIDPNISGAEDPLVITDPQQIILPPGVPPTSAQWDWGTIYWRFDDPIAPGGWSWYLLLRSGSDYSMVNYFRINDSIKTGSLGLPVPADWMRNIADFIEDGQVDYMDFAAWARDFLAELNGIPLRTDFNGDGTTDLADLELFLDDWIWQDF